MAKQSNTIKEVSKYIKALEAAKTQEEAFANFGFATNYLREVYVKVCERIVNEKDS